MQHGWYLLELRDHTPSVTGLSEEDMDMAPVIAAFLDRVTEWAQSQPTILGVALVGSHARGEARADSDIDLVLLCANLQVFLSDVSWIERFGDIDTCQTEDWGMVTSLRVHYRHGLEVEFGMITPEWAACPVDPGTQSVVLRGMRILLDRKGGLGKLQEAVSAL